MRFLQYLACLSVCVRFEAHLVEEGFQHARPWNITGRLQRYRAIITVSCTPEHSGVAGQPALSTYIADVEIAVDGKEPIQGLLLEEVIQA